MADLDLARGSSKMKAIAGMDGDLLISQLHPRYYQSTLAGRICAAYTATVATSVPATATIGLTVWNPPSSGVRLAMMKWTSQIVVTSAACTGIALAGGYQSTTPTTVTAATATGRTFVNGTVLTAGKAQAYNIATVLVAPIILCVLHHNTAAIAVTGEDTNAGDLEGAIVVDQGGFVCFTALGAAAAASAHTMSIVWEEVPINP